MTDTADSNDQPQPTSGPTPKDKTQKPQLEIESLKQRIILSATWVDTDTGATIDDPTEGDDVFVGDETSDISGSGQIMIQGKAYVLGSLTRGHHLIKEQIKR